MIRPPINAGDDMKDAVSRYARANGVTMAQAWAELVRAGIEAEGYDNDERHDSNTE